MNHKFIKCDCTKREPWVISSFPTLLLMWFQPTIKAIRALFPPTATPSLKVDTFKVYALRSDRNFTENVLADNSFAKRHFPIVPPKSSIAESNFTESSFIESSFTEISLPRIIPRTTFSVKIVLSKKSRQSDEKRIRN